MSSGLTAEESHLQAVKKWGKNKLRKQAMREKTVFINQAAEDQGMKNCNVRVFSLLLASLYILRCCNSRFSLSY